MVILVVLGGNCGGNWPVTSLENDFSDGVQLILLTGCLEVISAWWWWCDGIVVEWW